MRIYVSNTNSFVDMIISDPSHMKNPGMAYPTRKQQSPGGLRIRIRPRLSQLCLGGALGEALVCIMRCLPNIGYEMMQTKSEYRS